MSVSQLEQQIQKLKYNIKTQTKISVLDQSLNIISDIDLLCDKEMENKENKFSKLQIKTNKEYEYQTQNTSNSIKINSKQHTQNIQSIKETLSLDKSESVIQIDEEENDELERKYNRKDRYT